MWIFFPVKQVKKVFLKIFKVSGNGPRGIQKMEKKIIQEILLKLGKNRVSEWLLDYSWLPVSLSARPNSTSNGCLKEQRDASSPNFQLVGYSIFLGGAGH